MLRKYLVFYNRWNITFYSVWNCNVAVTIASSTLQRSADRSFTRERSTPEVFYSSASNSLRFEDFLDVAPILQERCCVTVAKLDSIWSRTCARSAEMMDRTLNISIFKFGWSVYLGSPPRVWSSSDHFELLCLIPTRFRSSYGDCAKN